MTHRDVATSAVAVGAFANGLVYSIFLLLRNHLPARSFDNGCGFDDTQDPPRSRPGRRGTPGRPAPRIRRAGWVRNPRISPSLGSRVVVTQRRLDARRSGVLGVAQRPMGETALIRGVGRWVGGEDWLELFPVIGTS